MFLAAVGSESQACFYIYKTCAFDFDTPGV